MRKRKRTSNGVSGGRSLMGTGKGLTSLMERGEVVKAFIKTSQAPSEQLKEEIQGFVKTNLSKHEYPREIEFLDELPKTPDGKIRRKELREKERMRKANR
jgi:acyl-coenzyme A synthetase/AMP-(fatty) acid ligase